MSALPKEAHFLPEYEVARVKNPWAVQADILLIFNNSFE